MEINKLPKWAQKLVADQDREIRKLTDELEARRAIDQAQGSELLAPRWQIQGAILDPYEYQIPIGDGHVRYSFDNKQRVRSDYIDARLSDNGYGRHVDIHCSHRLVIRPVASNSIVLFSTRD